MASLYGCQKPPYLVHVGEEEQPNLFSNINGVDCKIILELVYWDYPVNLQDTEENYYTQPPSGHTGKN